MGVHVGDALGHLRASHTTACLQNLNANFLVGFHGGLLDHKLIPESISATDNLDLVYELAIEDGSCKTNPVHLASKDLIAEQIAAEESAVRVSLVVAGLPSDIREVSKSRMSRVVLLLHVIEVLSVLRDIIVTDHVSQDPEGIVILMVDMWGVEENADVGIIHLIVAHHEKRRSVHAVFRVLLFLARVL